ncbi:hypothetical protein ACVCH0_12715, partial [Burkholderia glumae]
MINVSQRVNYFFARRDPLLRRSLPFGRFHWLPNLGARFSHLASLSAPRFRQRERGVILSSET